MWRNYTAAKERDSSQLMKRFLASLGIIALLLIAGLAWLIASGRPMEETSQDNGLQFDELLLDYSEQGMKRLTHSSLSRL